MNFVFICDTYFQKKAGVLGSGEIPNHNITTITANEFLETGKLPEEASAIIIEHGTWQKNFSLFRYFGLLPLLEQQTLAFVAGSQEADIKCRSTMKNEFVIPNNINAEEVSTQLNRLQELPPPAFTHPKAKTLV